MSNSSSQKVPGWVTQPFQLLKALEFSDYYNDTFQNTTIHEDNTTFRKSINQFLYWKRQLSPSLTDKTIIFTLLGAAGLEASNVMDVVLEASKVCNLTGAFEFFQAANPKFIGISFQHPIDHQAFASQFTYYKNCIVAYIPPVSDSSRAFSLLWLPPLFNINRVRSLLTQYSKHLTLQHGTTKIGPDKFIRSSTIRGTITLKDNITFDQVPHLISLPPPHLGHALLIISGRPPFCLKCLNRGHLRKDCPLSKCTSCFFFHSPSSPCQKISYAQRVSMTLPSSNNYNWADDVEGEEEALSPVDALSPHSSSLHHSTDQDIDLINSSIISYDHPNSYSQVTSITSTLSSQITDSSSPMPLLPEKCDHTFPVSTDAPPAIPAPIPSTFITDDIQLSILQPSPSEKRRKKNSQDPPSTISPSLALPTSDLSTAFTSATPQIATYSRQSHTTSTTSNITSNQIIDSPRSLTIPYTPFDQVFADAGQLDLLPFAHAEMESLFDASGDNYYESGSEGSSDSHMSTDHAVPPKPRTTNRKRKGISSPPKNTNITTKTSLLMTADEPPFTDTSSTVDPNTIPTSKSIISSQADSVSNFSKSQQSFISQLKDIFFISTSQASLLITSCPKQEITRDIIKSIKLLSSHGITYSQLLDQPQVLNLKFITLQKKVKLLQQELGCFTIGDICRASRIETTLFSGGTVKPSGCFDDS